MTGSFQRLIQNKTDVFKADSGFTQTPPLSSKKISAGFVREILCIDKHIIQYVAEPTETVLHVPAFGHRRPCKLSSRG